jgi:ribosomal protein S18 acetylase RimI-like enzyme
MGVVIRGLVAADREAVRDMLVDCGAFTDVEIKVALNMFDDGLKGDYTLLGAECSGRLSAYACIGAATLAASAWYIYWICVHRNVQGTGVGRMLQAAVEDFVQHAGGDRLVLEASGRQDNERVRRFYTKVGFSEVGRIPDFYKPHDDCVIYCKIFSGRSAL